MVSINSRGFAGGHVRSNSPLSDDQIMRVAPSVFADGAHESRSARYTYIPTIDVLRGLQREGFEPFAVTQGRSTVPGKAEYTKHMLRLRHRSNAAAMRNVGDEFQEIILVNSHDGTSSYQMMSGVFRLVCSNGMVVCREQNADVRVPHKGDIIHDVIQGAHDVLDGFGIIREVTEEMRALQLTPAESQIFAETALMLKYGDEAQEAADHGQSYTAPIRSAQLLTPRRREDADASLWTTFNRVQENVIRGGLAGLSANNRRIRTREVTGIDSNIKLNRALWTLAEKMAELKQHA